MLKTWVCFMKIILFLRCHWLPQNNICWLWSELRWLTSKSTAKVKFSLSADDDAIVITIMMLLSLANDEKKLIIGWWWCHHHRHCWPTITIFLWNHPGAPMMKKNDATHLWVRNWFALKCKSSNQSVTRTNEQDNLEYLSLREIQKITRPPASVI